MLANILTRPYRAKRSHCASCQHPFLAVRDDAHARAVLDHNDYRIWLDSHPAGTESYAGSTDDRSRRGD